MATSKHHKKQNHKPEPDKKHKIIQTTAVAITCAAIIIAAFFLNWVTIIDRFRGLGFTPTPEVLALKNDLNLTEKTQIIFGSTQPSIKERAEFNQRCSSDSSEVSVLGCYDGQYIYIYNITNPELSGIKQSTLAHELLHAAWSRLSAAEQSALEADLDFVYKDNADDLNPRLKLYSDERFYEELHSIIGTEFAQLPAKLETHYAAYFNNQDAVVAYHDRYNAKFQQLKQEAETLYAQITANQQQIEAATKSYDNAVEALSAAIGDFNRRAGNGSFTSNAAFQAERNALIARQHELQQNFVSIIDLVNTTNALIEEYNNNIARTQILLDSVNSNVNPSPTPEL